MKKGRYVALAATAAGILALAACGGGSAGGGGTVITGGGSSSSSSSMSSSSSSSSSSSAAFSAYAATTLVTDTPTSAAHSDANLINGWGLAFNPGGFGWVADQGTSKSTFYDGNGSLQSPVVTIPASIAGVAGPTGVVYNSGNAFIVSATGTIGSLSNPYGYTSGTVNGASLFIFDTLGGTIAGWSDTVDPNNAITVYDSGGTAAYTGLAILNGSVNQLYAADFKGAKIDVFNSTFAKINTSGSFTDPNIPAGYAPFGIQAISGQLYVSYAQVNPANGRETFGAGFGYVDIYDSNGNLVKRLISNGALNAPWGMAMAPANFGPFSNDLLVGNFGDGTINVYDPSSGTMLGTLSTSGGTAIVIPGLWGIAFGNGVNNQPTNTLFYAAGPGAGAHGAYGRIDPQ